MKTAARLLPGLLFALACATSGAQDAATAKPDLAKGEATSKGVCGACHTADGTRGIPAYPILQGQIPEYMVKQLADFKSDKRQSPIMKGFASMLSEQDMKNVAAFYSSRVPEPGFAKDKELAMLGERIWRGGIAERRIAACAGCHSPNGAGIPSQYPRLAGQHAEYTEAQLKAFRVGARDNSIQMKDIAAEMTDKEITAVADYIAGLR
jgi:cytochrome c553